VHVCACMCGCVQEVERERENKIESDICTNFAAQAQKLPTCAFFQFFSPRKFMSVRMSSGACAYLCGFCKCLRVFFFVYCIHEV